MRNAEACSTLQSQGAIDGAYAVKIFLDHHTDCPFSIASLARQCDVAQEQLKETFLLVFRESLDQYWEKAQWRALK
jgi:hypothetical protein